MSRIAVVTGAAGGMGQAISRRLHQDGLNVIGVDISWNRADDGLKDVMSCMTADLTDEQAVNALFAEIDTIHGRIDVLVNNAGTCLMSDFPEIPGDEFRQQMAINFDSCFYCCQAAIPLMLNRLDGDDDVRKIVNISSNGAYNFDVFDPPHYRASKAAMDALTKDLARRYATDRISVNSIAPAMTTTPLFNVVSEEVLAKAISAMPHGRAMHPSQIAAWVGFLVGDGGDVCSCNIIILNQGRDVR